jgi:hypothetical protein
MTLILRVVCLLGCGKRAKAPLPPPPHSSEGVRLRLRTGELQSKIPFFIRLNKT